MREFSHSEAGTSELAWRRVLAALPAANVEAVTAPIAIVSPHPDDEVLATAGLLQQLVRLGRRVRILSLTDGEAADPTDPSLGAVRHGELRASLDELGLQDVEVVRMGLPDGRLAELPTDDLAATMERAAGPVATWVAPLPHDGHPDHDAAGRAAAAAVERSGATLWQYAVWAWHWGGPDDIPLERGVRVVLDASASTRKRAAVDQFASQTSGVDPILGAQVRVHFERPYEVFFT